MGMISDVLGSSVQGGVKKKSWASLHSFFDRIGSGGGWWGQGEKTQIHEQLAEYQGWVASCVNVIARRVSEIDHKYYRRDLDEEIKKKNRIYQTIDRIFTDPNPFQEFRGLKTVISMSLDITGMAFVLREDDPVFGLPLRMWPLSVSNFRGLIKGETFRDWIKGFRFVIGGEEVVYSPDNILYFRLPSPVDPRDGWSVIRSQAGVIDIDGYVTKFERDFFKNSARPDLAISYPPEITLEKEDSERIIAEWKKKFQGSDNVHQIALLDSGAHLEKISLRNEDLALAWLAGWSKDKILSCFGVPEGKLGLIENINKNSAFSVETTFNREAILPRLMLMDEVFTRGILQRFDPRIEMKHCNPVPADHELLIKEAQIKTGVPTRMVNEQREIDGQKSIGPKGDVIMTPLNYVPLTAQRTSRGDDDV